MPRPEPRPDLSVVGHKDDGAKPKVFKGFIQQFPRAMELVAMISEGGAVKYDWGNWKLFPDDERLTEGMCRHLVEEAKGHLVNVEDFNLLVAGHTAWGAMARLEKMLELQEVDHDRTGLQPRFDKWRKGPEDG